LRPADRNQPGCDHVGRKTIYAYDPAGNRLSLTDPAGQATMYAYDAANQLMGVSYSDGKTPAVSLTHDFDGQRTSMNDGTGTSSYTTLPIGFRPQAGKRR
jgi:YD repeat-containing protein